MRLFSLQRPRDHYMLAVLSFLMVLAAAVLTVGSVFLLSFAGFLLVAVVTFVLMEMRHSVATVLVQGFGGVLRRELGRRVRDQACRCVVPGDDLPGGARTARGRQRATAPTVAPPSA